MHTMTSYIKTLGLLLSLVLFVGSGLAAESSAMLRSAILRAVVRSDGASGGYRWGVERKKKILAREAEVGSARRAAVSE